MEAKRTKRAKGNKKLFLSPFALFALFLPSCLLAGLHKATKLIKQEWLK
jgi:hypothetical protein